MKKFLKIRSIFNNKFMLNVNGCQVLLCMCVVISVSHLCLNVHTRIKAHIEKFYDESDIINVHRIHFPNFYHSPPPHTLNTRLLCFAWWFVIFHSIWWWFWSFYSFHSLIPNRLLSFLIFVYTFKYST